MQKSNQNLRRSGASGTVSSLLILLGLLLVGMAVGNVLALALLSIFFSSDKMAITDLISQLVSNPEQVPNGWMAMMVLQGTVHFFSYLLPSLIYWVFFERKTIADFNYKPTPDLSVWISVLLLVIAFIPFNSKFIEINGAMKLPEALAGVEKWMRDKEDQLEILTKFMTTYESFGQLLIALFVISVLPAIGEETLFRGVIQRKLLSQWSNPHLAIWVSAVIFSAIHFQFYGFLPRMLLGAMFGYLYYWSGSLSLAIFAHLINNGFVVLMMYLYNAKVLDINIEETKTMSWMTVIPSLIISMGILIWIKKRNPDQPAIG